MTPLEDKVRRAIHAKAGEVPSDAVPPLRLPARRRRFFPLAYGGGRRMGAAGGGAGWLAPVACAVLVVAVMVGPRRCPAPCMAGQHQRGPSKLSRRSGTRRLRGSPLRSAGPPWCPVIQ